MTIGAALLPFDKLELRGADTRQLLNYFRDKKDRKLQLIVVIVPEMKGPYSE